MAVAFGTAASATNTATCSIPASTAAGDLLIASITFYSPATATVTTPTGWTLFRGPDEGSDGSNGKWLRIRSYWRIADGSEGASLAFSVTGADYRDVSIARWTGTHQTAPIDTDSVGSGSSADVTTRTHTGITTTVNNAVLVVITSGYGGAITSTPAGMTQRLLYESSLNAIYDESFPTAGATGNRTQSQNSNSFVSQTFAIVPPAGGATGQPTTKRFGGVEFFAGRGPAQQGMRQW